MLTGRIVRGARMTGTGWVYATVLVISALCMLLVDRRWRLALFRAPLPTALTIASCVAVLLLWDLAGIRLGLFIRGAGPWQSGLQLAHELPVEELLFLTFLSHLTLVIDAGLSRLRALGGAFSRAVGLLPALGVLVLLPLLLVSTARHDGNASMTYLLLDAAFLVPLLLLAALWGGGVGRRPWDSSTRATLAVLALLTALFDSLLIAFGIIDYDWSLTSGVRVGLAPVEDFAYVLATATLAPVVLRRLGGAGAATARSTRSSPPRLAADQDQRPVIPADTEETP